MRRDFVMCEFGSDHFVFGSVAVQFNTKSMRVTDPRFAVSSSRNRNREPSAETS